MTHTFKKTGTAMDGTNYVCEENHRLAKREVEGIEEYWVDGVKIGDLQDALTALEKPVELSEQEMRILRQVPDGPFNAFAMRPWEHAYGVFVKGLFTVEGKIGQITEAGKALRDR